MVVECASKAISKDGANVQRRTFYWHAILPHGFEATMLEKC
ncbi:hypothetical protein OKW29_002838 [Paraburkholderia sp. CI3]